LSFLSIGFDINQASPDLELRRRTLALCLGYHSSYYMNNSLIQNSLASAILRKSFKF
jgi:hypothetical protein